MLQTEQLTQKRIFWFWVPLAVMWLSLSTEQPSVTAVISRLPDVKENLAAFGLTFALALIIESPVIMLLAAATALAKDQQAYRRLLRFTYVLGLVLTGLHLVLALTPLYRIVVGELIGAPESTIERSRIAFLLMTPWTAMIGYRRLHEGVMIRYGYPYRVTMVIVVRMAVTLVVLAGGLLAGRWQGAPVAAVALSVAVTAGALSAWRFSRRVVEGDMPEQRADGSALEWGGLGTFYAPLAFTSLITMAVQPLLAFGLSRAARPLESLAIWPVVMSVLFIGRSVGMAFQEVAVALLDRPDSYAALRRFAWTLALAATAVFALFALTPGAALWYRYVSGLEPVLAQLAVPPTAIIALIPGLEALISWRRAQLIHRRQTRPIGTAIALNMATLAALMSLVFVLPAVPGAVLAASALTLAWLVECLYLWWQTRPVARLAAATAGTPAD